MIEFQIGNLHTRVNKKLASKEEWDFIHSLLAVKVPGFYFSKKFRHGQWDGTRKFFNRLTGTFYTGLLGHVERALDKEEIVHTKDDRRVVIPSLNKELDLSGIEFRAYQNRMVYDAIRNTRGIISAPPNSGKTEVACGIIQVLGLPTNFLTHRIPLLMQTRDRLEQRLGIEIGVLGAGLRNLKEVNVMSVATLHKKLGITKKGKEKEPPDEEVLKILQDYPVLIGDECHHVASKTFEDCFEKSGAYYRFGLSATPLERDEINNMLVRGLLGDTIVSVTNKELMDSGISARPSVYLFEIDVPKFPKHYPYDKAYEEGIVYNKYRNQKIVDTVDHFIKMGRSIFIIVYRIAHGEELVDMLTAAGIRNAFIQGSTANHNYTVLESFKLHTVPNPNVFVRERKLKCVVSTVISDEGLDIPAMNVLIIAVGDKSSYKTIQRVGRGLRKKDRGQENVVTIVDFLDNFSPYMKKHSHDRFGVYVDMGMDVYEIMGGDWENLVKVGGN